MKKILSLALIVCMLFSMGTTVFADDGYSTKVRFEGGLESYWELDVPTSMAPGETAEVTLEGTWDTTTVYNVRADEVVTMGNDIDNNVKELSIDFTPINQAGDVTNTITVTRDISVESMGGDYFGTWEGVFNYYLTVDKAEVVDELEQDADGNYLVNTAADLFTLSRIVNSGAWIDEKVTVLLTDDIDLQNKPFTPIGKTDTNDEAYIPFIGVFDGQGNTIYNLNVTASDQANNDNSSAGLFAIIGKDEYSENTVIKNLKVDGATINSTHFAGVITGTSNSYAQISDCEVKNATVTSTYYNEANSGDKVGVIAGCWTSESSILNCLVENAVVTASRDAGQITGYAYNTYRVVNCTATDVEVKWNGLGKGTNIREDLIGRLAN